MINIIKGNVAYLNGVMNLYFRVKNDFKKQGVNIYQDNEYPNREVFERDLLNSDRTLLLLDNDLVIGFITSDSGINFATDIFNSPKDTNNFLEKHRLIDYKGRMVAYERLMIDPDYRNQGYGSKLLNILDQKYSGSYIIFLAHQENRNAIKLYGSLKYNCLGLEIFKFGKYYVFAKNLLKI